MISLTLLAPMVVSLVVLVLPVTWMVVLPLAGSLLLIQWSCLLCIRIDSPPAFSLTRLSVTALVYQTLAFVILSPSSARVAAALLLPVLLACLALLALANYTATVRSWSTNKADAPTFEKRDEKWVLH